MNAILRRLAAIFLTLAPPVAMAQQEPVSPQVSPDGKWQAAIRVKNFGKVEDYSIRITPTASPDGANAIVIPSNRPLAALKWSPDSSCLAMLLEKEEPSENNPLEYPARVYRLADQTLRDLSGYFPDGFVDSPTLGFQGRNSVVLSIQRYTKLSEQPEPSILMHVDLAEAGPFLLPIVGSRKQATRIERQSPDHQLKAVVQCIFRSGIESFNLSIQEMVGQKAPKFWADCPQNRVVDQAEWSPDSRFLVITTSSSGGHSPLNEHTYVYCRDDNSLRFLSNYRAGTWIARPEIAFARANTVILGAFAPPLGNLNPERFYSVAISLGSEAMKMPKARE